MPSPRFHPLLVAGAACLALAACGSDEDPPQANAPAAQNTSAAPTQTAPTQTAPAQTTATDAAAPDSDRQSTRDEAADDAQPTAPNSRADSKGNADGDSADTKPKATPSDKAPKQGKQSQASPLEDYAAGGSPATDRETADVRATLLGFQEALGRRDPVAICVLTVGLPEKSGPTTPMSCTSLTQGPGAQPPSDENRRMIASSAVTVSGNKATADLAAGFKMPLRKIDGRWRIDYATINSLSGGSR